MTGVFLTLIQPPFDMYMLAWVSFLPMAFISSPAMKKRWLIIFGYISCVLYWLVNIYWLCLPTTLGCITFCLYMGIYWPLLSICIRYCRARGLGLTFILPVLIVGAEAWQSCIFGGFSWRLLGHSMYKCITMIQVADILGVAGITFYIAMVNGLLAELMLEHPRNKEFKVTLVAAVIIAVMFYGERQLDRTEKSMKAGPMIASLQTNEPLTIDGIGFKADDIFEDMIAMSSESLESSPAMIVWPETMVLNTFDSQYLDLRGSAYRGYEFEHIVRIFSMNSGVAMVIGATGGTAEYKPQSNTVALKDRTNAAYVYDSDGRQLERYDKIHLVPFGEFVPFKYSWPWLYNILMKFTPYPEDDFSLLPGKEFTTYNLATPQGNYRYAIIICYEDTVVPLNRKFVVDANGVKRVDWLVNISNDGWFSWRNDEGDVVPTSELFQHAVICSFRAVENRVGIVRSVNTGVSCFIEPTGRIKYGSAAGTLPGKVTERQGVSGWLADNIAVDDRVTFFSRHGQWLDYLAGIFFWPIIILSFQKLPKKEIEAKNVKVR